MNTGVLWKNIQDSGSGTEFERFASKRYSKGIRLFRIQENIRIRIRIYSNTSKKVFEYFEYFK
jgi:hypothetical protein